MSSEGADLCAEVMGGQRLGMGGEGAKIVGQRMSAGMGQEGVRYLLIQPRHSFCALTTHLNPQHVYGHEACACALAPRPSSLVPRPSLRPACYASRMTDRQDIDALRHIG